MPVASVMVEYTPGEEVSERLARAIRSCYFFILSFFFFQAEDGIRDPLVMEFRRVLFRSEELLCLRVFDLRCRRHARARPDGGGLSGPAHCPRPAAVLRREARTARVGLPAWSLARPAGRSKERRVGKGG